MKEEDIPLLLSVGKEHLFVWEKKSGSFTKMKLQRSFTKSVPEILPKYMRTEIKEGKIEVVSKIDGILKIRP